MKTLTLSTLLVLGAASSLAAQQPPPTYEQAIVRTWKALHDKILTMAKDTVYPDAKLGWKPHPDSRSVLEELRHVTLGLRMTSAIGRGEKFNFEAEEKKDMGKPKTRARS